MGVLNVIFGYRAKRKLRKINQKLQFCGLTATADDVNECDWLEYVGSCGDDQVSVFLNPFRKWFFVFEKFSGELMATHSMNYTFNELWYKKLLQILK